jgi:hypothetical protein
MKLANIKPNDLALVIEDTLIPVGEALDREGALLRGSTMLDLIANYDSLKGKLETLAAKGNRTKLDSKLLKPPVEQPSKIWAAA